VDDRGAAVEAGEADEGDAADGLSDELALEGDADADADADASRGRGGRSRRRGKAKPAGDEPVKGDPDKLLPSSWRENR
jgi:hypothetical protein